MLEFRKLTQEELGIYIENTFSGEEEYENHKRDNEITNYYMQRVEDVHKRYKSFEKGFEQIKKFIAQKEFDNSYNKCITLSNSILKFAQDLRVLPVNFGCSSALTQYTVADDNYPVEFHYMDNGILHIVLPEVLPHRMKINTQDKHIAMQDYHYNKQRMYNAFAKEFEYGKFKVYDESVVLYFLNVFRNPRFMIDADNIDTKIITDIISGFMLIDDNPFWCKHYIDAKIGEDDHTEVFVVPKKEFVNFIKERIG